MISYLQVDGLSKMYGEKYLFRNISFGIGKDDKTGLIAKNGTGKTTLMNILTGSETQDSGEFVFRKGVSIGYLPQDPSFNPEMTIMEEIFASSNEVVKVIGEYEEAIENNDHDQLSRCMERMDSMGAWDFESRIKQILTELKIVNLDQKMKHLSGGQRKRVALANVLINEPDFLILDEPTNHLDMEMIEWLEEYIKESRCTLFMVTHDRYFLDRVCSNIVEMDSNAIFEYTGNYSYYLEKREERIQSLNASIDKAKNLLRTELEWMRKMPRARGTKAKYRVDNFYKVQDVASQKTDENTIQLDIKAKRLGGKILEFEGTTKAYDGKMLIKDFTYKFNRFEKVGIIGKNGCGKSTMLNLITKKIAPDSGTVEVGEIVDIGYYRQDGLTFRDDQRVIDIITEISEDIWLGDGKRLSPSQFLEHFLFTPDLQYSFVSKLSGGERRRLYLMTILMKNPNFLILDEPTNDLDIMTLNILEDYLQSFKGCVIIVSHDRYFMDKIVDNVFVFEGDGVIKVFPGNFSDYSAWLAEKQREEKKEQKREQKAEALKPPTTATASANTEQPAKKKPSFKEKKEYDQLTLEIEQLAAERVKIETELSTGAIPAAVIQQNSIRLGQVMSLQDEKELRWLELSEMM